MNISAEQIEQCGTPEYAEAALYAAIAKMALETDSPEVVYAMAQAFDLIQGEDDPTPEKPIHSTESSTMLESRFWDDGARVCGFTPRDLPKSKYRYKEGPDHVV